MKITVERLRECLDYSPETGAFKWRVDRGTNKLKGKPAGVSSNGCGYRAIFIDGRSYLAHRLAWFYCTGAWPKGPLDHINGNRADNRLSNLRCATSAGNRANSAVNKNCKTGIKGVQFRHGRWRSKITHSGKTRHLGVFDTPAEASAAYIKAAAAQFGEFARAA